MSKIAQMKITLTDVRPPTWRRILIDTSSTLADLHQVIQNVIGWTNAHLHAFNILDESYEPDPSDPNLLSHAKDEHKFTLKEILSWNVREFEYVYDFGDNWVHKIEIENVIAAEPSVKYPVCIKGKCACPPEDIGGPWRYMAMLKVLKTADNTQEKREFLDRLGNEPFEVDHFNLKESNIGLSDVQPGTTDARNAFA